MIPSTLYAVIFFMETKDTAENHSCGWNNSLKLAQQCPNVYQSVPETVSRGACKELKVCKSSTGDQGGNYPEISCKQDGC